MEEITENLHSITIMEEFTQNNITFSENGYTTVINETTKETTRTKSTIPPAKLKKKRDEQQQQNLDRLIGCGLEIKEIKGKTSDAWKYFGQAFIDGKNAFEDKYVCKVCLEGGSLQLFSVNTSLSSHKKHLDKRHGIFLQNPRLKSTTGLLDNNNNLDIIGNDDIVTRTALMFVMTSTPFNMINDPYFIDWLVALSIIKNASDVPSDRQLAETGLDRLYKFCQGEMIQAFKNAPDYIVALFDCWSDLSARHFLAIIFRFLDDDFQLVQFVVAFKALLYKTSDYESTVFDECVSTFQVGNKKFLGVSDRGSDMIRLCRIRSMERSDCIAHALHNLIHTDVLPKVPLVNRFLKKLRAILAALRQRKEDLKVNIKIEKDRQIAEFFEKCLKIDDTIKETEFNRREFDLLYDSSQMSSTMLKKDVSTRWTSIFEMVSSFQGKITVVNQWLGFLLKKDLEINPNEEEMLPYIVDYFKCFMLVTKILEGNDSTMNLSIVMLEDVKCNLVEKRSQLIEECNYYFKTELVKLFDISLENLEIQSRFKVNDFMLLSTLLDPVFQKLSYVQTLLTKKNLTKATFIENMYHKYVGHTQETMPPVGISKTTSLREKLAFKHGLTNSQNYSDLQKEIEAFEQVSVVNMKCLLTWWRNIGKHQFPLLSKLARIVLQLSATSAEVERLNSKAGRVITKDRTSLANASCHKIMTVFYNFPYLKKCHERSNKNPDEEEEEANAEEN